MISIGTRVYIGYTPDHLCVSAAKGARCMIGTVVKGPYPPGERFIDNRGRCWRHKEASWSVLPDGWHTKVNAAEHLLHPIDDETEMTETEAEECV